MESASLDSNLSSPFHQHLEQLYLKYKVLYEGLLSLLTYDSMVCHSGMLGTSKTSVSKELFS